MAWDLGLWALGIGSLPEVAFFRALFILVSALPESQQGFFARSTVVQQQGSWALPLESLGPLDAQDSCPCDSGKNIV